MIYTTKEQIHGVKFKHKCDPHIYTLDTNGRDNPIISWGYNSSTSSYTLSSILDYINEGTWKIIESPNNEPQYEIY